MEYLILESTGVEISHIDGAAFNNFSAGKQNGIIPGVLGECSIVRASSTTLQMSTGELLIQGFRIKITSPYTLTKPTNTSTVQYYLVAKLVLRSSGSVSFSIEARTTSALIQNNLFTSGTGTYEVQLCKFTVGSSGISNLVKTVSVISGMTSDSYTKTEVDNLISQAITNTLNTEV